MNGPVHTGGRPAPDPRVTIRETPAARLALAALAVILAAALPLAGCHDHPLFPSSIGGWYHYVSYDTAGVAVAEGTIVLVEGDSTALRGSWDIGPLRGATGIGPQTGTGQLAGSSADGIAINLNPSFVDNNVVLRGTFDGGRIAGNWQWISFVGVTARGRFAMTKP